MTGYTPHKYNNLYFVWDNTFKGEPSTTVTSSLPDSLQLLLSDTDKVIALALGLPYIEDSLHITIVIQLKFAC